MSSPYGDMGYKPEPLRWPGVRVAARKTFKVIGWVALTVLFWGGIGYVPILVIVALNAIMGKDNAETLISVAVALVGVYVGGAFLMSLVEALCGKRHSNGNWG